MFAEYENTSLVKISGCVCPNHIVILECTVHGRGSTVWQGTAVALLAAASDACFSGEIVINHDSTFTSFNAECTKNNRTVIVAHGISSANNSYTSQLSVTMSVDLVGTIVECVHDNFQNNNIVIAVGNFVLDYGQSSNIID